MTTNPSPAPPLERVFASLRRSPVTRSSNRRIAGVCGGFAERIGIAPGVVRIGAVVVALLGPGIALYLLAWLLLPAADGQIRLEQALRGGDPASVVLLVITALSVIPDLALRMHVGWLTLLVIGIVGYAIYRSTAGSRGSDRPDAGPAAGTPTGPRGPDGQPQDAPRG